MERLLMLDEKNIKQTLKGAHAGKDIDEFTFLPRTFIWIKFNYLRAAIRCFGKNLFNQTFE